MEATINLANGARSYKKSGAVATLSENFVVGDIIQAVVLPRNLIIRDARLAVLSPTASGTTMKVFIDDTEVLSADDLSVKGSVTVGDIDGLDEVINDEYQVVYIVVDGADSNDLRISVIIDFDEPLTTTTDRHFNYKVN